MKIVVLNHADLRLEFLDVPDDLLNGDAEKFLIEHGYPLDKISWFAAPIDSLPVTFHHYGISKKNGGETHSQRQARLKDFSIGASVQALKWMEQKDLADAVKTYGEQVDGGYEYCFEEGNRPIVAAYSYDEPCDVIVLSAKIDRDGSLSLFIKEKENLLCEHEIEPDEVFAGHLDFVIAGIRNT